MENFLLRKLSATCGNSVLSIGVPFYKTIARLIWGLALAVACQPVYSGIQETSQIYIIDSSVPDADWLKNTLGEEAYLLNENEPAVQQITDILADHQNLDAIHFFSHGQPAQLSLESAPLGLDDLPTYKDQLVLWGNALKVDGELILYGCNVAQGRTGQFFVRRLAEALGRTVGASTDLTGEATQGGNWDIEYSTGLLNFPIQLKDYRHILQSLPPDGLYTFTNATDNGDGTYSTTDGFFLISGSDGQQVRADAYGAYIDNNTRTTGTSYVEVRVAGGGSYQVSSSVVSDYNASSAATDNNFTNVHVIGYLNGNQVAVTNYHSSIGVYETNYNLDFSGFSGKNLDAVRVYYSWGEGTSQLAFNLESISISGASHNSVPAVSTTIVSTFDATTASLGGNVTADGGASVTERGIVYATTSNPTTLDNKIQIGTGTGSYSQSVTGLTANTTYYVKAYAINSVGTSYGSEVSFTTASAGVLLSSSPTLTFTTNSADITGDDIASDGEGGSLEISDIDIDVFGISNTNGTLHADLAWKNNTFLTSNDGNWNGLTDPNAGSKGMAIKSSDESEFKLIQFEYYNWGETSSFTNTIVGYRDGGQVATTTFDGYDSGYQPQTVTLSSAFSNVDEVRFYISAGGYEGSQAYTNHTINNIQVSSPITNTTPALTSLNGDIVAWPGVGNTVTLDATGNATVSDTELDALNGGNGDYAGGSISIQRSGGAVTSDVLGFDTSGALFTVSGSNLQSGGQTFATFTNTNGVLIISFTSSGTTAITALVTDVTQRITYRNDTPAGDATVRFTLSDGSTSDTADVTVTTDNIYITETTDTNTIDVTNGVSFSEAIAIAAADGTGTQTLFMAGSMAGQTVSATSATSLNESLTLNMDDASGMTLSGGTLSLGGGVTLTLNNGSSDTGTLGTAFSGTGSLAKTGDGTVTLTATQTYSGTTTFTGGTVSVASDSHLGSGQLVLNGGTLSVTGNSNIDNAINIAENSTLHHAGDATLSGQFSGNANLSLTGSGQLQLSNTGNEASSNATLTLVSGSVWLNNDDVLPAGAITLNGGTLSSNGLSGTSLTIDNNFVLGASGGTLDIFGGGGNFTLVLSGVISGTGNLLKTSAAKLSLTGINTYTGTTTIQSGQVIVAGDSNLGSGSVVFNGGTLTVTGSGVTIDNPVTMTGDGTLINANAVGLSGVIAGTGTLTKTGAGTLTLSGTQTHTGNLNVTGGSISIAGDSNLGSGTLTLNGGTLTVTGSSTLDNAINLGANHGTLSNSNDVTLSGVIAGSGNFTKAGAGSLTLSGSNSYSGSTALSAGKLIVTGTLAGAVSVATGTTLEGTGNINGLVTVNSGGTLQIGASPGTMTLGNGLTLNSGGTLVARINGTTAGTQYDQFSVTGPVMLGGALNVIGSHTGAGGESFVIINNDSNDAISSTFNGLAEGSESLALNSITLAITYVGATGNDVALEVVRPEVTDGNISISGATGTGGAYKIGDTVTVTWDNSPATGDNNFDITSVSVDFSAFGGGSAVAATNSSDIWTATYTIVSGAIDGINRNVSVTATNNSSVSTTTADTSNAQLDNIAPVVSNASISISGATGTGGAFKIGDTVTATWDNSAFGDDNSDNISAVTIDFSQFGGGAAVAATNSSGTWTATYTLTAGAIDGTNINVSITATDNGGNTATTADTSNAQLDNIAPVVSNASISISGATGTGGAFKIGDTVTATWDNSAFGDDNSDNISAVTIDFSQFGGGAAVAATNSSGTWTATYTLTAGVVDGTNINVSITANDNAGNTATTADTSNATVDTTAPVVLSTTSSTPNGSYKVGDLIAVQVVFDQNITVTGTPRLELETGDTDRSVNYASGSGTNSLTFSYTVQTGDATSDLDYTATSALDVNGGFIIDDAGNAASLSLASPGAANSLGNNKALVIDGIVPVVSSVSVPANGTYLAGDELNFTVNTSENVTVNTTGGTPQLSLTVGTTTRQAAYQGGSGTGALIFRYTVQSGDLDTDGIAAGSLSANGGTLKDGAGNNLNTTLNSLGTTSAVLVDAVAPTISSVNVPANGTYVAGQYLSFTVNTSESVTVNTTGGTPQLSLTVGTTTRQAAYHGGSGTGALVFRYTVQSGDTDTDGIAAGSLSANGGTLKDGAGNNLNTTLNSVGATNAVLVDAVAPAISGISIPNSAAKVGDAITVTITAGESGLSLNSGTVNGVAVTGFTDNSDNTYSATYTVAEGNTDRASGDDIPVSFVLNDAAGNSSAAYSTAISQDNDAIDANSPVISSLIPLDNTPEVPLKANLEITFGENITFGSGNLTIFRAGDDEVVQTIAVTDASQVSVSGTVVTINPASDLPSGANLYVQIDHTAFEDQAGNGYAGITDKTTWNFIVANQIDMEIDAPSVSESNSGLTPLTFTVTLAQPAPAGGASVNYSTSDGTALAGNDYTAVSGTLSFAAGETSKTIEVLVSGDAVLEADETLNMTLSEATGTNVVLTAGIGIGTISNDDAAAVTLADISGSEDDGAITLTATLDNAVQGGFRVDVNTADGTATAGSDYTAVSGHTLTFAGTAGETQTFTIAPASDNTLEADETLMVSQSNLNGTALNVVVTDGATVTISNDDAAAVTIADISGSEDDGAITLTATLDNAVQGGFRVDVNTADGTATAGSDYTAVSGHTLTFAGTAGETQTFTIAPASDNTLEADETLMISQSNLDGTALNVVVTDGATVTISNDDAAAVTIADISGSEDDGAITLTATLDNAVQGGFRVDVNTADGTATAGSDYTAVSGHTLTFAGTAGETQSFTIAPASDNTLEADETLMVSQSNLDGTALNVVVTDGATVTISNDDAAAVTIADISGSEDDGAITLTATLDNAVQGGFRVDVNTADGTATAGSDYTAVSGHTLTFAGTAGETQTFTITPASDNTLEADETLMVSQSNLDGTALNVVVTDGATVTISNEDAAAVTIADISGSEDDGAITLTATLDNAVQGGFRVDVNTADGTATAGSDYTAVSGHTLTFAGTAGETQTFTITPASDYTLEADETLMVSQSSLGSTTLAVDINDGAVITILNDDHAPLVTAGQDFNFEQSDPNGTVIGTVLASDADANTVLSDWTIVGGNIDGAIAIDPATGELTLSNKSAIDFAATPAIVLSISVSDGTNTSATGDVTILIGDQIKPAVTLASGTAAVTNASLILVTASFSEVVLGFEDTDISVSNGTVGNLSTTDHQTYSFEVNALADGAVTVSISGGVVQDNSANANEASNELQFLYDNTLPEAAVTVDVSNPTNKSSALVTINFSEQVFGFDASDVQLSSGTVATFSGSITSYVLELSGIGEGVITVSIPEGIAEDSAGNGNKAASLAWETDLTPISGFSVEIVNEVINSLNYNNFSFNILHAEDQASFAYTISASSGTPVVGTGTLSGTEGQVSGIDVSSLPDGLLSLSVVLTDLSGNQSEVVTDQVTKVTLKDIPQGYSPNGDGVDDDWVIPGIEEFPNNKVSIYNRYGAKVWEISGYNNQDRVWDSYSNVSGVFGSSGVPDGTYFYIIEIPDTDTEVRSGFVIIKR